MYQPVFFKAAEFEKCSPACSMLQMDQNLLIMLDELRSKCGFPIILTSAFRSSDWDKAKGRSGTGPHTKGMAVDIVCRDSFHRRVVLQHALQMKFTGIGISDTFIHLDIKPRSYGCSVWLY